MTDSNIERQGPSYGTFQLVYSGRAFQDGTIPVEDLAPVVLAVNQLVQEVNRRANGGDVDMIVRLKSVEKGSTVLTFMIEVVDAVASMGAAPKAIAIATVIGILADGQSLLSGFFSLVKLLKGKPPKSIEDTREGKTIVYNIYNDYRTTGPVIAEMLSSPTMLKNAEKIAKPIKNGDADEFYLRTGPEDNIGDRITKEDLPSLRLYNSLPKVEEVTNSIESIKASALELRQLERPKAKIQKEEDGYFTDIFSIISAPMQGDTVNWEFGGPKAFTAIIADESFLRKVRNGTAKLGKGDLLEIEVVVSGLTSKPEYKVLKVIRQFREVA